MPRGPAQEPRRRRTVSGMADLSALGASSGGVWTRPQSLEVSTAGRVRAALGGHWQVVWPGTYADAGTC